MARAQLLPTAARPERKRGIRAEWVYRHKAERHTLDRPASALPPMVETVLATTHLTGQDTVCTQRAASTRRRTTRHTLLISTGRCTSRPPEPTRSLNWSFTRAWPPVIREFDCPRSV